MATSKSDGSSRLDGILFAEDFGDDETQDAASLAGDHTADQTPSIPDIIDIEPHFSADEIAAARKEGFDAGRLAGRDDACAQHQRQIAVSCAQIADLLQRDTVSSQEMTERSVEAVARLLIDTLAAMLPSVCNRHAAHEIAETVRNLICGMSQDIVVSVRIAASQHEAVRAALAHLPAQMARRIVLVAVDIMPEGDATLEWAQGAASHSPKRARQAALEILERLHLIEPQQQQVSKTPNTEWQPAMPEEVSKAKIGETIDA